MVFAMVKVLPLPVTPSKACSRIPPLSPATSFSIAAGWSPVGLYEETSLNLSIYSALPQRTNIRSSSIIHYIFLNVNGLLLLNLVYSPPFLGANQYLSRAILVSVAKFIKLYKNKISSKLFSAINSLILTGMARKSTTTTSS